MENLQGVEIVFKNLSNLLVALIYCKLSLFKFMIKIV